MFLVSECMPRGVGAPRPQEDQPVRRSDSECNIVILSQNDSVAVERLAVPAAVSGVALAKEEALGEGWDLKTLNVRANARKRVGVNALHHSVVSFS